jgi:transposase-like protein
MAQHFLLSAAARSLSAAKILRMSDGEVVDVFLRLRWPQTDGKPVCPGCGCTICYACPRSADRSRWRCKACRGDFSVTSGTLFAHHKLPLRTYLLAIVAFCHAVKGKSMLALSRELDVQYKTALCGRPPEVNRGRRGTLAVDYAWTTDPCSMLGVAQHALISREASLCSHWHPVEKISSCRQRVSQFGWRAVSPSRPRRSGCPLA